MEENESPATRKETLASVGSVSGESLQAARGPSDVLRAAQGGASFLEFPATPYYEVLAAPFDVLVGADGAKSKVRSALNASFDPVAAFQVPAPPPSQRLSSSFSSSPLPSSSATAALEVTVGPAMRFATVDLPVS